MWLVKHFIGQCLLFREQIQFERKKSEMRDGGSSQEGNKCTFTETIIS